VRWHTHAFPESGSFISAPLARLDPAYTVFNPTLLFTDFFDLSVNSFESLDHYCLQVSSNIALVDGRMHAPVHLLCSPLDSTHHRPLIPSHIILADDFLFLPIPHIIFLTSNAHFLLNLATPFQLYPTHKILSNLVSLYNPAYLDQVVKFSHKQHLRWWTNQSFFASRTAYRHVNLSRKIF
jgi:hypothetical protein